MKVTDRIRRELGLDTFGFTPTPRRSADSPLNTDADMREVWKRLARSYPFAPPPMGINATYLLNSRWFPSAMQGCKL